MKNKIIIALLAFTPFYSFAQNATSKIEAPYIKTCTKTNFFPFVKKGYRPQIALSLVGGMQINKTEFDENTSVIGVEASLQCPLLCTGKNYIRQQLTILQTSGSILKSTDIELNPHYRLKVSKTMEISAGPGLGINMLDIKGQQFSLFTYGVGASIQYYFKKIFVGFEPRYMLTDKVNITSPSEGKIYNGDFSNTKLLFKVGLKF